MTQEGPRISTGFEKPAYEMKEAGDLVVGDLIRSGNGENVPIIGIGRVPTGEKRLILKDGSFRVLESTDEIEVAIK
jgi:hypothetical protein